MPPLTEKAFMAQVLELAKLRGWRVFHPFLSKWSEKGWPDLILARPPRLLAIELKTDKGKLTPEQEVWLWTLRAVCGIDADCWRPRDWDNIVEALR